MATPNVLFGRMHDPLAHTIDRYPTTRSLSASRDTRLAGVHFAGERLDSLRSLVASAGLDALAANEAERSELAGSERPRRRYPAPQRVSQ